MIIKNKKAGYEYFLLEQFTAGIVLTGTEIKSIREGKVNLTDSFCSFEGNQLFLKNTHIAEYEFGNQFNHIPKRPRVLLLTKRELKKLRGKTSEKGLTIVPVTMFINDKGFCKVTISLAKGKKNHDKRNTIRDREEKIKIKRDFNINI